MDSFEAMGNVVIASVVFAVLISTVVLAVLQLMGFAAFSGLPSHSRPRFRALLLVWFVSLLAEGVMTWALGRLIGLSIGLSLTTLLGGGSSAVAGLGIAILLGGFIVFLLITLFVPLGVTIAICKVTAPIAARSLALVWALSLALYAVLLYGVVQGFLTASS